MRHVALARGFKSRLTCYTDELCVAALVTRGTRRQAKAKAAPATCETFCMHALPAWVPDMGTWQSCKKPDKLVLGAPWTCGRRRRRPR